MRFYNGIMKPYQSLRRHSPSVYYLEEFCYKVLPVKVDTIGNVFIDNANVTNEGVVTLNFPEFLDVSVNLELVKSVHYATDVFFQKAEDVTNDSKVPGLIKPDQNNTIGGKAQAIAKFPDGMIRLFFGYRYTPIRDPNKLLEETESLCCRKLAEMEDDCFEWREVTDSTSLKIKTAKTSTCKYKVEINIDLMLQWLTDSTGLNIEETVKLLSEGQTSLGVNFICHPPYQGRMSFKDNLKILYPFKTVKFKTLDKISFRTNRSYVQNNKLYEIIFIEKESDRELFKYDSVEHSHLFTAIKQKVDTREVNSYMDEEVDTFSDGVVVDFEIPTSIRSYLTKHRNYKIRIITRDLTTQNR